MKHVIVITTQHGYEQWLNDPKITILKEFISFDRTTQEFTAIIVNVYIKDL